MWIWVPWSKVASRFSEMNPDGRTEATAGRTVVAVIADGGQPVRMVAGAGSMGVLVASDADARASAARLSAEADPTSAFGEAVLEVFEDVAKGEQLIVLRPDREVTPAGAADLLGVIRQFVDRLLADGTLEFRHLPGSKHRRIKVGDVLAPAEERDRRQRGADAIRSALR